MRSEATAAAEHTVRNNSMKNHLKKDHQRIILH